MNTRHIAQISGWSYVIIFFAAIFANFFVLEGLKTEPLEMIVHQSALVKTGILAFLWVIVCDVIVAWGLHMMYKRHLLSVLSTLFRMMHAAIFAVAIGALVFTLSANTSEQVLLYVKIFETLWLIGLFFFGGHLLMLGKIAPLPSIIRIGITAAGIMYMVDTMAHFTLSNYADYAGIFLALVAIPSIFGEMALAGWLLTKAEKHNT